MAHRPRLTEKDLHSFIRPKKRSEFWRVLLVGVILVCIFASLYILLNAQAFLTQFSPSTVAQVSSPPPSSTPTPQLVATATTTATPIPTPTPLPTSNIPNNTVAYDAQNISAPINWDVPFETNTVLQKLETGVIHLAGTPHPGQQGDTVIFGHSSYYPWAKGDYKSIFAPLLKAKVGDSFEISYQNVEYTYRVTKVYEVKPTELTVLNSSTTDRGARLITCAPIGTSLNRFVVEGTQISPDPQTNTQFTQRSFSGTLPSDT